MTTYLVTRHSGTLDWAYRQGLAVDRTLEHLEPADLETLRPGDVMIGSLPVHLAAQVCARGARFVNLSMEVSRDLRGQELDAAALERLGVRLEGYQIQCLPLPGPALSEDASEVQVCILSDQLLPNLITVLQIRPVQIYALASQAMQERGVATRFARLLGDAGIPCLTLTDLPERLEPLRTYAETLVRALASQHWGQRLVLNATGGSKPMSLALVDAFRSRLPKADILYTDTSAGELVSLRDGRSRPLTSVLDIPWALEANGARYLDSASMRPDWEAGVRCRESLTRWLASHVTCLTDTPQGKRGFLSILNRLINDALDDRGETLHEPNQQFFSAPRGLWLETLEHAQTCELLKLDPSDDRAIQFASAEAARYLRGGWLEEYAWLCTANLTPEHYALGVQIEWGGSSPRPGENELDLVIVHRNRSLLVECKTGRLGHDGEDREQRVLALLDSLGRHATGALGTAWLLSAQPLSDAARDRARHYHLHLIEHEQLHQLPSLLREWMSS